MGFGTYARRVRDEAADPRARHAALRCAVGRYCPLGFNATWAYVTAVARPLPDVRRDVPALLRALDVLEASRSVLLAETAAFAAVRRAEKAAGRRTPRPADLAAFATPRWPGRTAPSRLGLVAAVADRHRWFRGLPFPDASLAADERARDLADLRDRLGAAAGAYLAGLGDPDGAVRASAADALRGIDAFTRPGYAPLNAYVLPWRRFAALLAYAAQPRDAT
ncbi:hypothetical protein [Actinomadura sp. WAC 06369]|uniref:hypothetical protein n=1 Tax=Actinomadura sp. WAC 06369 TaxID=2203193 RepID=UPI000F78C583|nr:hypothetical protein [Actinomadura sp. WAC 06369]RSN67571.1 hypothetical protein DMH08_12835 [Actinomadura sp. WAC 06369]